MFEWIDPWKEIERAERMERDWYRREEYFHQDMRMAVRTAMEENYHTRKLNEKLMKAITDAAPIDFKWTAQQWRDALS